MVLLFGVRIGIIFLYEIGGDFCQNVGKLHESKTSQFQLVEIFIAMQTESILGYFILIPEIQMLEYTQICGNVI